LVAFAAYSVKDVTVLNQCIAVIMFARWHPHTPCPEKTAPKQNAVTCTV